MKTMEINERLQVEVDEDKRRVAIANRIRVGAKEEFTFEEWDDIVKFVASCIGQAVPQRKPEEKSEFPYKIYPNADFPYPSPKPKPLGRDSFRETFKSQPLVSEDPTDGEKGQKD